MQARTIMSLLCAALIGGLTVFAATEVKAAAPLSLAATPQPPPRECTRPGFLGSSVKIQAGPDLLGTGLADQFPKTVACPTGPDAFPGFDGQCKEWVYRWTFTNMLGLAAGVSVDSDVTVLKATPTAQVAPLLPFFGEGERFIKFNLPKVTTFTGSYLTGPDVGPGTLTAGFLGSKGIGHCRLAGADNPIFIPEPNQAVNTNVVSLAGPCTVTRTIDVAGRTISLVVTGPTGCEPTVPPLKTLGLDGHAGALFVNGETQITVEGSTLYCWPSTFVGKMSCMKIP
jgi:hypothetical protein